MLPSSYLLATPQLCSASCATSSISKRHCQIMDNYHTAVAPTMSPKSISHIQSSSPLPHFPQSRRCHHTASASLAVAPGQVQASAVDAKYHAWFRYSKATQHISKLFICIYKGINGKINNEAIPLQIWKAVPGSTNIKYGC